MAKRKEIMGQLELLDFNGLDRTVEEQAQRQEVKMPRWEVGPSTVGGYRQWVKEYCRMNKVGLPNGFYNMRTRELLGVMSKIRRGEFL
ncbi:hypothetical protein HYV88_00810 [Candidatus Woesearchaeota archaeon]|nr:hypothetical protein [Candidatus Woesearchaeota archaeon]